jgi:pilus assembly protein Flp/PilA
MTATEKSSRPFAIALREIARFRADECGATAIEYAIIASGVGAFIAATVWSLGSAVKNMFTTLSALFRKQANCGPAFRAGH